MSVSGYSNPARDELAKYHQWVNWREKKAVPKPRKIPVNPHTGGAASSTDPATWGTLAQCAERSDKVGYVFAITDPFGGLDLDCCRDPETGVIHERAWHVIRAFNSYTEISPSKTGVKIFGRFKLPPSCRNETNYDWDADAPCATVKGSDKPQAEIAIFDHARYFTFTSDHLEGTPWSINDCQGEAERLIDKLWPPMARPEPQAPEKAWAEVSAEYADTSDGDLTDEQVLKMARASKAGVTFDALNNGNWNGYPSQSEADFAFLCSLAFWCQRHPAQMERLFRDSGLWTAEREKQKGRNYIRDSVNRAIDKQTETYTPRKKGRKKVVNIASAGGNGAGGDGGGVPFDPLTALNLMGFELKFLGAMWRGRLIMLDTDQGRVTFESVDELADWRKARNTICADTQVFLTMDESWNVGATWDRAVKYITQIARQDCQFFESPVAEEVYDATVMMWEATGCKEADTHEDLVMFVRQCQKSRRGVDDVPPCIFRYKDRMIMILPVLRAWLSMPVHRGRDLTTPEWRAGLHANGWKRRHNPMTVKSGGQQTNVRVWQGSPKRFVRMVETVETAATEVTAE